MLDCFSLACFTVSKKPKSVIKTHAYSVTVSTRKFKCNFMAAKRTASEAELCCEYRKTKKYRSNDEALREKHQKDLDRTATLVVPSAIFNEATACRLWAYQGDPYEAYLESREIIASMRAYARAAVERQAVLERVPKDMLFEHLKHVPCHQVIATNDAVVKELSICNLVSSEGIHEAYFLGLKDLLKLRGLHMKWKVKQYSVKLSEEDKQY